jgi:hypothetical protein
MRTSTSTRLTAATVAALALFGAACDDDVEEDLGDIGDAVESEVEQGVDEAADAATDGD